MGAVRKGKQQISDDGIEALLDLVSNMNVLVCICFLLSRAI